MRFAPVEALSKRVVTTTSICTDGHENEYRASHGWTFFNSYFSTATILQWFSFSLIILHWHLVPFHHSFAIPEHLASPLSHLSFKCNIHSSSPNIPLTQRDKHDKRVPYPYKFKTNKEVPDSFGDICTTGFYPWESCDMSLKPSHTLYPSSIHNVGDTTMNFPEVSPGISPSVSHDLSPGFFPDVSRSVFLILLARTVALRSTAMHENDEIHNYPHLTNDTRPTDTSTRVNAPASNQTRYGCRFSSTRSRSNVSRLYFPLSRVTYVIYF